MQILIVGFGRSGTTLTYRTFKYHCEVKKAFLETCHLAFHTKESLYRKHPAFKDTCVEKVIYNGDRISKRKFTLDMSIYDYCVRWLDYFGDEARIIQLARHPLDTLSSLIIKRGRKMKMKEGKSPKESTIKYVPEDTQKRLIETYFSVVPKYPKMISNLQQTKTIKYEEILLNTHQTLKSMFNFCGLRRGGIEKLRPDRAFNYKHTGFRVEHSIDEIVNLYNEIAEGIKYEIP